MESKLVAQLPLEEPLREKLRHIAIDPNLIDEVQIYISPDSIEKFERQIFPANVIRFNQDDTAKEILGQIPAKVRIDVEHEGHKYIRVEQKEYSEPAFDGQGNVLDETEVRVVATLGIYQPDAKTIVFAEEARLKRMLSGGNPNTELIKRLKAADQNSQIVAVFQRKDSAMVEKLIGHAPPKAAEILSPLTKGVEWIAVTVNADKGPLIQVAVDNKDKKAADQIMQTVDGMLGKAKSRIGLALQQAAGHADAESALVIAQSLLAEVSANQDGPHVRVTFARPTMIHSMIAEAARLFEAAQAEALADLFVRQLGFAFFNYADVRGALPPADDSQNQFFDADGKPLLSWRVQLLPYAEYNIFYDTKVKFGEPWDSPANKPLLDEMPPMFITPGVPNEGKSTYHVFTGKGTFFPGRPGANLYEVEDHPTILLIEVSPDKAVPWTKPGGIPIDSPDLLAELGMPSKNGYRVIMSDGSLRFLKPDITAETLKALVTPNGGEVVNREDYLAEPVKWTFQ